MKTSARNHFTGMISSVKSGAVNDEVELETDGGVRLVATVTSESRTSLSLEVGSAAFALIKASSIIILVDRQSGKLSARNQLVGTVAKLTTGAVNSEVVLELAGGSRVAAIITNESVESLGLAEGMSAMAIFKASSVILGVDG